LQSKQLPELKTHVGSQKKQLALLSQQLAEETARGPAESHEAPTTP